MTGYVRKDTTNNIADGNVINAADLDAEFDGVQDAFNASTGHKHDGTAGEGATINALGPTQDVTISATLVAPKTTNTVDVGSSSLKFKDLFLAGNASVGGTLAVTGVATLGNGAILGTPASGTVTNLTGTASININGTVGATTPTTGAFTTLSASSTVSGTGFSTYLASPPAIGGTAAAAGSFTTLSASSSVTLSGGTANGVAYLNGSKVVTSGSALVFDGSNFGVGISSPNYLTTLYKATLPVLQLANSTSGSTASDGLLVYLNGANATISNEEAGALNFQTSGLLRATFDSSGNLGLGVTPSPWAANWLGTPTPSMEFGASGTAISGGNAALNFAQNAYWNGTNWIYSASSFATRYQLLRSSGQHQWFNAASGTAGATLSWTQAMTLDASGNLGVGTTSPSARLEVSDTSSAAATSLVQLTGQNSYEFNIQSVTTTNSTVGARYNFAINSSNGEFSWSNSGGERARIDSSGNLLVGTTTQSGRVTVSGSGWVHIQANANGSTPSATDPFGLWFGSNYNAGNTEGNIAYRNFLTFASWDGTTYTDRARIDSSGNLLVGTTSGLASSKLYVEAANNTGYFRSTGAGTAVIARVDTLDGGTGTLEYFQYGSTEVGKITTNGTLTVYNTTSDYRLKNVIGAVTGHGERLDALEPIEYEWKSNGSHTRGFLAHQFQEVYADSVTGTKDAVDADGNPVYQAMQASTAEVIADLVAEIQSLRKRLADAGI